MQGYITNEGKAFAEGSRNNREQGRFVLDATGQFVPASSVHLGAMFQGTREAVEFQNWEEEVIIQNAGKLHAVHSSLTYFPSIIDTSFGDDLRIDLARELELKINKWEIKDDVLSRFRTAYKNSGACEPILLRDKWDYEKTLELIDLSGSPEVKSIYVKLRSEGVF